MGPTEANTPPFALRNWLTIRCALRRCEFMADSLGAHCTTDKCNVRIQILFHQADQWRSMIKLYELATQGEFETISKRLVNKET